MNKKMTGIKDKTVDEEPMVEIIKIWRPAHEVAQWMLEVNPIAYAISLAIMYGEGQAKVPPVEEIPILVKLFGKAKKEMIGQIDQAMAVLKEQLEEATQKKQEKEKD